MTCSLCSHETTSLAPDSTGLLVPLCDACKARPPCLSWPDDASYKTVGLGECALCGHTVCWANYLRWERDRTTCRLNADSYHLIDERPWQFADGTQPGKEQVPPELRRVVDVEWQDPPPDREPYAALQSRTEAQQELAVATARAEAAIDCLRTLVKAWRKEMRGGYATPEQQWALRRAEEMCK